MDPYEDLKRKMEPITPLKKCPECGQLSIESHGDKIICTRCGFKQEIQR